MKVPASSDAMETSKVTGFSFSLAARMSATPEMTGPISKGSWRRSMRPVSIFDRSRMSLMIDSSNSEEMRTVSAK